MRWRRRGKAFKTLRENKSSGEGEEEEENLLKVKVGEGWKEEKGEERINLKLNLLAHLI